MLNPTATRLAAPGVGITWWDTQLGRKGGGVRRKETKEDQRMCERFGACVKGLAMGFVKMSCICRHLSVERLSLTPSPSSSPSSLPGKYKHLSLARVDRNVL